MENVQPGYSKRISSLFGKRLATRLAVLPPRLIMFVSFAGMSLMNYGFGLAAGWLLAPGDFGLLAFTQTLLTITGLVLNSGFAWSLTAQLVGASESRRAGLVRGAFLANLLLAFGMGALILLLYAAGPLKPGLESWTITGLVIVSLPLFALVAVARATVQGYERFGALASLWLVETGMKAILGIGLVQVGYGAAGAIAGFLFGSLCAAIAGFIYLVAALKIQPTGKILRPAFHLASAMFGALLGMALLLNLDLVALKLFSQGNRAAVGWYQAGTILANTPYYLLTATIPILFTQIARHQVIGKSVNAVADTLRLALIVLLPIEGVLAGFPHFFLHLLFPAPYLAGAPTLRLLALGNAAIILVAVFSTAFQASGNPGFPGKVLLSITLLESLVLRFVVPRWHGVGASTTFLTATSIALLILGWSYLTHLDQDAVRQALTWMKKYLVALLAGATGAAVMVSLGRADWLAVGWGGVVYLVVIAWLKLFSISGLITRPTGYQNGSTPSFGERSEIE